MGALHVATWLPARVIGAGLAILFVPVAVDGQCWSSGPPPAPTAVADPESTVVVPAEQYRMPALFRVFAGNGYRHLWATPILVEVGDLSTLGGGLTPIRLGGGATTRTLHVRGEDGKRYVLRSVDKFVGQGIPEELQGTIYESVLQDQISAFLPTGAMVLPPLLEAVGVLHVRPRLVFLPYDPRLGEFEAVCGGMLMFFEERPDEGPDGTPGFAGSREIVDTEEVLERVEQGPADRVDGAEYLRARLIDLLVGDRDRSVNNWRWARFPDSGDGGRYRWRPIPRDRDQAFIRLDGLLKWYLRWYEPRLVRFDERLSNVSGLTRNAWDMDRWFLTPLDRAEWDAAVLDVQRALPDSVLALAVSQLPPEHHALVGADLLRRLRTRRDGLPRAAEQLFEIVNHDADLHGTDASERVVVTRVDGESMRIRVVALDGEPVEAGGHAPMDRVFRRQETREVRLYLHGGRDTVVLAGERHGPVDLRIMGGHGRDLVLDSCDVHEGAVRLYDAGADAESVRGPPIPMVARHVPHPRSWGDRAALTPDWGRVVHPVIGVPYEGDLGLVLSGGVQRTGYGFLHDPFRSRLQVRASYATGADAGALHAQYEERGVLPDVDLTLAAFWSQFEIIRFYGYGNATTDDAPRRYHRIRHTQTRFAPAVRVPLARGIAIGAEAAVLHAATDTADPGTILFESAPYGSGSFWQLGLHGFVELDLRDRPVATGRGLWLRVEGSHHPPWLDVDRGAFQKLRGEVRGFLSWWNRRQTLAVRAGVTKLWGTFPLHSAAFLGGTQTLRGYREQRFAGDGSLYGSLETRVSIGRFVLLFPNELGVHALLDAGRVYDGGASPGGWHHAVGGGLWVAPVDRGHTLSLSLARSVEGFSIYLKSGFHF